MSTPRTTFEALPPGESGLVSARPGPDLAVHDFVEREYVARGTATSLGAHPPAPYATRVVVRRPASPGSSSGTVVVEWLNVSSGSDAAPDWTCLAAEVVRRGHAWVGVSAQHVGVEGGPTLVALGGVAPTGLKARSRYAALSHPGDAWCHGIFTDVAKAMDDRDGPLGDLVVDVRLAVGESQSAIALTTYANEVRGHPFAGFLVHSRGGPGLPPGEPGCGVDLRAHRGDPPVLFRDDLDVPVLVVQTETDLLLLGSLAARQPDTDRLRLWEVAGAAHADRYQIDTFEDLLGCPLPVNRGQQAFVARAALRRLDEWARGGAAPPVADRLVVEDGAFVLDADGNARGGVRTPAVDAPVELLRGDSAPGASYVCRLFGSTLAVPVDTLRARWPDAETYLAAYAEATERGVAAGVVLPEDRAELLADARPDLVRAAHGMA